MPEQLHPEAVPAAARENARTAINTDPALHQLLLTEGLRKWNSARQACC